MVELDYSPKPIKNEDGTEYENPIKGKIRIRIPNYVQALELSKSLNFKASADGVTKSEDSTDSTIKYIKEISNYVLSVDLVIPEMDDFPVKDLDTLGSFDEGKQVINEIGQMIIKGFRLGKR